MGPGGNKQTSIDEYLAPFTIEAIHIVNQEGMSNNLINVTAGFRIFESIDKHFLTADLGLVDGVNILKYFRFTGQEFIRIALRHGTGDDSGPLVDINFRVYKLFDNLRPKETVQSYKLQLCDPTMFISDTTRISKVYRGSHSEMLFKVLNSELNVPTSKIDHWEDTETENNQFVCPNWKASTLLKYFEANAFKGTNSAWRNGMFFYQTMARGFHFKSIDQMCSGETTPEFRKDEETKNEVHKLTFKPTSGGKDEKSRNQILSMKRKQLFNTMEGTNLGLYASTSYSYDSVSKIQKEFFYDIEDTMNRSSLHLSGRPLIRTESMIQESTGQDLERAFTTGNPKGDEFPPVKTVPYQFNLAPNRQYDNFILADHTSNHDFDNSDDISKDEVFQGDNIKDNSKLERIALRHLLKQNMVEIIIPVRTDITVGNVIELVIPEPEIQDDNSTTLDLISDNRYLVVNSCLTANVQTSQGSLQLDCVKESFAQDIKKDTLEKMIESSTNPQNIDMDKEQ